MMTIRRRMMLLLSLLTAACLAAAAGWQGLEEHRARLVEESARREKTVFYEKLLALRGSALAELAFDYTYWDELVRFVRRPDPRWSEEMLVPALRTFEA